MQRLQTEETPNCRGVTAGPGGVHPKPVASWLIHHPNPEPGAANGPGGVHADPVRLIGFKPYSQALKLDLAACVVMASGNDYLPGVRGLLPVKSGLTQLWAAYLAVRASKRYSGRWGPGGRVSSTSIGQTGIFGKDPQCNMQLHNVACQRCTVLCTGFFLRQCTCLGDGCLSRRARRTLVKRNVKTGALAFDSGVLSKTLEKRGVAPPLSEAAAAAWDDHLAGQLLPADALEYLQVPDSHVAQSTSFTSMSLQIAQLVPFRRQCTTVCHHARSVCNETSSASAAGSRVSDVLSHNAAGHPVGAGHVPGVRLPRLPFHLRARRADRRRHHRGRRRQRHHPSQAAAAGARFRACIIRPPSLK